MLEPQLLQDNQSSILLAKKGRAALGKRTRAMNVHYFAIKDVQKFLCKSYQSENEQGSAIYSKALMCESCLTAFFSGI